MEAVISVMNTAVETYYLKEREVPSTDHKSLEAAKDLLAKVAEAAGGDLSTQVCVMKLSKQDAATYAKMKEALSNGNSSKANVERAKLDDKVQYVLEGIAAMNAEATGMQFHEEKTEGTCMSCIPTYTITGSWEPVEEDNTDETEEGELMDLTPVDESATETDSELIDLTPANEETAEVAETEPAQTAEVVTVTDGNENN